MKKLLAVSLITVSMVSCSLEGNTGETVKEDQKTEIEVSTTNATTKPNTEIIPEISKTEISDSASTYTMEDVATHNTKEDCFAVVDGKVYDISKFIGLGVHNPIIEKSCGTDATDTFSPKHAQKAIDNLENYKIGTLAQ